MKTPLKILLFIIVCAFINTKAFTQKSLPAQLYSFSDSLYNYRQINGNILVAQQGNVIFKKSFGFANFENKTPNTDSTGFALASTSKIFTSAAVLQLRDKGKLKLDDAVIKYFPDFPYPDITIRNLLSHTSGLPDYELYEVQISKNPGKIFTNKDVLPSIKMWNKPLNFKPGEKWGYSNTNFCLLALLVEKLSGLTFQQYLQRNIFNPSKMFNTYFSADAAYIADKNRAVNYEFPFIYSGHLQNADSVKRDHWRTFNASGFVGQGNITTTTLDMLKFDAALYLGKILKPSTLNEAFTPVKLKNGGNCDAGNAIGKASYGLGWFILADSSAGKIVWHTGGQPGALSIFLRNISKKQTVIMFDNAFNKSLYANGANVMAILNNQSPKFRKIALTQAYGSTLVEKGADAAFCKLQELKADAAHYYLSEDDMNELGLRLLYEASFSNHLELSLEVLKINTLLFPNSFNTYDSYGEALAAAGKTEEAIFMYKKSLQLNPDNEGGKRALKRLLADLK